jgi:pilus assembly protein Flp/PilA
MNSLRRLHNDEAGQGLVEYLLIIALVGFAATAGMSSLASKISSAFTQIGTTLGSYIT